MNQIVIVVIMDSPDNGKPHSACWYHSEEDARKHFDPELEGVTWYLVPKERVANNFAVNT